MTGQLLHGAHVDVGRDRALLAVDLDTDKCFVHERRDAYVSNDSRSIT
jgi:hypothetical protein